MLSGRSGGGRLIAWIAGALGSEAAALDSGEGTVELFSFPVAIHECNLLSIALPSGQDHLKLKRFERSKKIYE